MSYLFQSHILPAAWVQLVAETNSWNEDEKDSFEVIFTNSYEVAIANKVLPIRDRLGLQILKNCQPNREYFVDLRDFCNWGKSGPNTGIPSDEHELAGMLGIHDALEQMLSPEDKPTKTLPYKVEQINHPPDSRSKALRTIAKAAPHRIWSGEFDEIALLLTPQLVITDNNVVVEAASKLRLELLATPNQLIEAFGPATNMQKSWFDTPKDTPKLINARKVPGRGGYGSKGAIEPLYCPYEVMHFLFKTRKNGASKLPQKRGWTILSHKFKAVYNEHIEESPLENKEDDFES